MAWIELHDTLPDHPKTLRLAELLGVPPIVGLAHLLCLLTWVIRFRPQGVLDRLSDMDINRAGRWSTDKVSLREALLEAGFLEYGRGGKGGKRLQIHDWEEYTTRYRKAKRDRERRDSEPQARESRSRPPARTLEQNRTDRTGPEQNRQRRRGGKSGGAVPVVCDGDLDKLLTPGKDDSQVDGIRAYEILTAIGMKRGHKNGTAWKLGLRFPLSRIKEVARMARAKDKPAGFAIKALEEGWKP